MVYEKNKALDIVGNYKAGWGDNKLVYEKPSIHEVAQAGLEMRGEPMIEHPLSYDTHEKRKILMDAFYISLGVVLLFVLAVNFKLIKL